MDKQDNFFRELREGSREAQLDRISGTTKAERDAMPSQKLTTNDYPGHIETPDDYVNIPPGLAELAETDNLPFKVVMELLRLRNQVVHYSPPKAFDWRRFCEEMQEHLEIYYVG